jgi:hypothetical protein
VYDKAGCRMMRHPVFCRAFSGLLGVCCFFGVLRVLGFFRGVRRFSRFPVLPAAFCRGPHAAVGETLLGRKSFVNELSANRRYRKICYYESGGIVFLSYFIVFLVGAWSACRGRLLKKMGYDLRAKLFSFVSGLPGRDLLLPLHN